MRFTTSIPILLTFLSIALAQTCDGGTACGYSAQLCCSADEMCMTDENNQAICSFPALSSSTPVVSSEIAATTPMPSSSDSATVTPMSTLMSTSTSTSPQAA